MRIAFFEIMPGEQEMVLSHLPVGHEALFYSEPLRQDTIDKAAGAQVISIFVKSEITQEIIGQLPEVKLIVTRSMGTDHIDMDYAKSRGIQIGNVTTYASHPVAEFTFALLLAVTRKIYLANAQLRTTGSFDQIGLRGFNLFDKTIGIVGTGRIGKNVISIAKGFGMKPIAYDLMPDAGYAATQQFSYVSLNELVSQSDIISIHAPSTKENHHLIGTDLFAMMKKGAILINTARGELINTHALIAALKSGTVGGAGLDVLESEQEANQILIDHPQVVVTPHIAFETVDAQQEIIRVTTETITQFLSSPSTQS